MPITPLPTPPSRDDAANFSARADSFLAAIPTFAVEANALADDVTAKQAAAADSEAAAADSADAAAASAAAAATYDPANFYTKTQADVRYPVVLATQTLASPAAMITFAAIPQTYRSLRIELVGQLQTGTAADSVIVRLNNDTGANYDWQLTTHNASSVTTQGTAGATYGQAGALPAALAPNFEAGTIVLEIPLYSGTAFRKTFGGVSRSKSANSASGLFIKEVMSVWRSTAAVTRIDLIGGGGDFAAATTVVLIGVP